MSKKLILGILFLIVGACNTIKPVTKEDKSKEEKVDTRTEKLLSTAESQLGRPYKYAGNTPKGFDCSGFTNYSFSSIGILLSRDSRSQSQQGLKIPMKDIQEGDLVFFKKGGRIFHVAMVYKVEAERFAIIHSTSSRGVVIDYTDGASWRSYWKDKVAFARRVL
ncbi:MAG: C40 family peptidase [Bacteroidota bacterium]